MLQLRRIRALAALASLTWLAPAAASTYNVNSTADLPDADTSDGVCATAPPASCTLRAAVMQSNVTGGGNVAHLPAGSYVLKNQLEVTAPLDVVGDGDSTIIDADGAATSARAIEVVDTSLSLEHVTVENGNASGYGGAIYAHGGSYLALSNVLLLDNAAALAGGAVYAVDVNTEILSSIVQGNTSQGDGGGIAVVGQTMHPVLVLGNTEVANNQAQGSTASGGGVSVGDGAVSVTDSFVHDNTAGYGGGGLSFAGFLPDVLQIADSVFDHNTATQGDGGGLRSLGKSTIERTQLSNNSAGSGGGISGQGGPHAWTDIAISGNHAYAGGGVEMGGGSLTILRGRVDTNTAILDGGGFDMINPGYPLTLTDSTVFDNSAANGGGAWVDDKFTATACAIYGNHATTAGGGIFAGVDVFQDGAALVELNDTILDHNRAGTNGGGLYVDATAQARLHSSTITANAARQNYPSPGSGGGVYIDVGAIVITVASVFAYNIDSALIAAPSDCSGTMTAGGYDFVGSNSGCTIIVGGTGNQIAGATKIDPKLSAFERLYDPALPASPPASAKFGRVPLAASSLIDSGPSGGCIDADGDLLLWDEIGQSRTLGGRCDIGAVEYGAALDEIFSDGFGA
jgi:hypothetical protein